MSTQNTVWVTLGVIFAIILAVFAFYMIDVDQTQEARLPDVEVTGGQMPKFDAETGSVDVGSRPTTVPVPKVTVEEETVNVPTVEINPPPRDNPADNRTGG
jgi:hypothetical protein